MSESEEIAAILHPKWKSDLIGVNRLWGILSNGEPAHWKSSTVTSSWAEKESSGERSTFELENLATRIISSYLTERMRASSLTQGEMKTSLLIGLARERISFIYGTPSCLWMLILVYSNFMGKRWWKLSWIRGFPCWWDQEHGKSSYSNVWLNMLPRCELARIPVVKQEFDKTRATSIC